MFQGCRKWDCPVGLSWVIMIANSTIMIANISGVGSLPTNEVFFSMVLWYFFTAIFAWEIMVVNFYAGLPENYPTLHMYYNYYICSVYIYYVVCIYTCTYIPTYLHTYIPTYLRTYIPTYLHTYIPTYLHTYIPTYLHTYIHTYIYIYTHTSILIQKQTICHMTALLFGFRRSTSLALHRSLLSWFAWRKVWRRPWGEAQVGSPKTDAL